jgi:transcriptional regulator with XRE-family HTH domain
MTTLIHPTVLRAQRKSKGLTQQQLSDATRGRDKVSLPTVKRIESTKGGYKANNRVAKALAKALGIEVEMLSTPPSEIENHESALKEHGYRPLRTMLDAETALAFKMVEHIYGIPIRSQIDMAPLFTALLAEASLAWRRERVGKIEETANQLMKLGSGHFAYANAACRALDGAVGERESIEKRDLFGENVDDVAYDFGFDPSTNNPFADFLKHLAAKVEAKTISFDENPGWKTSEGLPEYRIGAEIIDDLTGDDPDAEYALLRGHARLKDFPQELLGEEKKTERIAWMIARIPKEEMEKRKAEQEKFSALMADPDLSDLIQQQDGKEEGHHA